MWDPYQYAENNNISWRQATLFRLLLAVLLVGVILAKYYLMLGE